MKKALSKKYLVQYIIIAVILAVCAVLFAVSRRSAAFADSYRDNVFSKLQAVFGRISGALPFSLGELMIMIALLGGISFIAVYIILMIRKKGRRRKISAVCSLIVLWIVTFVMLTETLNCFIMYRCSSFASVYGIGEDEVKQLGAPYEPLRDAWRVTVPDTAAATEMIIKHPGLFRDFEITKGKMDDVFLAVTGKKLTGGSEK